MTGVLVVGLVIFGLGGAADLAYHLLPTGHIGAAEPLLRAAAPAHLAILVGMAVIFAGVVARGLSNGR
ncbi:MAG: hypothetical protein HY331_12890 [Chloroflexi bacterium]|nr:hypothetical protein [Chloroflexota bacterium]